jgi:hypothetical protein
MSTFNLFDKLRYLPTFFGNWTLDIVPTLDNMIMKVLDYNNIDQYTCSNVSKQGAFQCYGIGTPCMFTQAAANAPNTSITLIPQAYTIHTANFYTSQFKLIPDRYISLASQFSQQPLQLPFVKVVSTPNGKTFAPGNVIESVTKQAASKIDSLFITFHYHRAAKAVCVQPYITDFKLTVEEAGNNTYPGGGISMNTYEDHVQYQMLLDALNLNNNSLVSLSHEYYRSCFPAYKFQTYQGIAGGGFPRTDYNLFSADTSNFLLGIPFAADSSHMEGLARTSTDINWTTQGEAQHLSLTNTGLGVGANTIENAVPAYHCVFSTVYDWVLIMMSNDIAVPNQGYSMQTVLNG